jgi:RND family efflux transporter MFP subunit
VAKGQLILELDDREYRVALTEAQNQYLEALGRLALEDETLDSRAAGDRLLEDLAAIEDLLRQGTITQREYQDRKIQMEVEAVKQGARRGDLVQVRSGLAGARAAQDRAQLNLEQTEIRAPFAGVVSNLGLTAGQHLNLGDVVCDIVDNVNLEAEVAVLESDLKGLETGRPVRLQIPAIGDTLDVTVDVMSPRIDPVSRTCNLLMRFKNDAGRIRPGMFVRASIAGDIYPDRLMVPREAILTRDGRPMLFRIENERAKWVYVELGPFNDRFIEIAKVIQGGPLEPGALAVISDHLTLTHDAKVKVRKVVATQFAWAIPPDED